MNHADIESHGVIGNLRTTALVADDGTINHFCFPRSDSPGVFLSLVDPEQGGSFTIRPLGNAMRTRQMYLPDTNVLVTRYMSPAGMVEVTDYMPVGPSGPCDALVRRLRCIRGAVSFEVRCEPRVDVASARTTATLQSNRTVATFDTDGRIGPMRLRSTVTLTADRAAAGAIIDLREGDAADFVLECIHACPSGSDLDAFVLDSFEETVACWRGWSERSGFKGRWRDTVQRSALVLKLLGSADHGAGPGATRHGLPNLAGTSPPQEAPCGGVREVAFAVRALLQLGHAHDADGWVQWTKDLTCAPSGACRVPLHGLGALVDVLYLADRHGAAPSIEVWRHLTRHIDWLCDHWNQPDHGFWRSSGPLRDHLSTRLFSWVALDRALRMSQRYARAAPIAPWRDTRDEIAAQLLDDFWHEGKQAFVQYRGGDTLDAAVLLMPLVKFIHPSDPRWRSTLDAVGRELSVDGLVARETPAREVQPFAQGVGAPDGTTTACSFWYAECLAAAGRVEAGRLVFEKTLSHANPVGLHAEQIDQGGRHVGNGPNALAHLALISAALAIDEALDAQASIRSAGASGLMWASRSPE